METRSIVEVKSADATCGCYLAWSWTASSTTAEIHRIDITHGLSVREELEGSTNTTLGISGSLDRGELDNLVRMQEGYEGGSISYR